MIRRLAPLLLVLALAGCDDLFKSKDTPEAKPATPVPATDSGAVPTEGETAANPEPEPPPPEPVQVTFPHGDPGILPAGSGSGVDDGVTYAPDMRFPLEKGPAYANSQVWGAGGMKGPPGGQCAAANYSYPWNDNFCESRSGTNVYCASGTGHQGQDIRPATCEKKKHMVVAAEDGVITSIGGYTVFLTADSGRLYRYLHMDMADVKAKLKVGQKVKRGERIGLVSADFNGTPTTTHLHFEIKMAVTYQGQSLFTFVPPYSSLVNSYNKLLNGDP